MRNLLWARRLVHMDADLDGLDRLMTARVLASPSHFGRPGCWTRRTPSIARR